MASLINRDDEAKADEEKVMNEILQKLQNEQPKIDQSLKNLLTVILGKVSSHTLESGMDQMNIASDDNKEGNTNRKTSNFNLAHFTPSNLLSFVKLFLGALQETALPSLQEYFVQHPQKEDESAIAYLNRICDYKASYFLREKVIQNKSKISKIFGKSYFLYTNVFPEIKQRMLLKFRTAGVDSKTTSVLPTVTSCSIFSEEEFDYLLKTYEESIFGRVDGSYKESNSYNDLIWAKNFQETLQEQQKKRTEKVEEQKNHSEIISDDKEYGEEDERVQEEQDVIENK